MWYLTVSAAFFFYWLKLFWNDKSTPKSDLFSWIILVIAPLLWPISFPASVLELMTKSSAEQEELSLYMGENQLG